MRLLRWIAPLLATLALFALPAIEFSAPLVQASSWSVAQLGISLAQGHSKFADTLHHAESLRQQFGGPSAGSGMHWPLVMGALIPISALVAGLATLLSWLWTAWAKPGVYYINAIVGLAASAYAIGASWWLTHAARLEVARGLAKAQANFGGALGKIDWKGLTSGLTGQVGVTPDVGLYVLFLIFLAMLVWPWAPRQVPEG